jgi:uncharacterized protein with FMN-binding domain
VAVTRSRSADRPAPRRLVAALALCALLTGCPAPSVFSKATYLEAIGIGSPDVSALADGRYEGAAKVAVPLGSVAAYPFAEVEVRISGGKYSELRMIRPESLAKDPGFAKLADRIIAAQSPDVDLVVGCSFTSRAYQLAVVEAVKP